MILTREITDADLTPGEHRKLAKACYQDAYKNFTHLARLENPTDILLQSNILYKEFSDTLDTLNMLTVRARYSTKRFSPNINEYIHTVRNQILSFIHKNKEKNRTLTLSILNKECEKVTLRRFNALLAHLRGMRAKYLNVKVTTYASSPSDIGYYLHFKDLQGQYFYTNLYIILTSDNQNAELNSYVNSTTFLMPDEISTAQSYISPSQTLDALF